MSKNKRSPSGEPLELRLFMRGLMPQVAATGADRGRGGDVHRGRDAEPGEARDSDAGGAAGATAAQTQSDAAAEEAEARRRLARGRASRR